MSSCSSPLSPSPANFSTLLVRQRFAASDRRLSPERLLLGQNKHPGPTRRIRTTKPEPNISMSITVAISLTQLREASVKASLCPCAPRSLQGVLSTNRSTVLARKEGRRLAPTDQGFLCWAQERWLFFSALACVVSVAERERVWRES